MNLITVQNDHLDDYNLKLKDEIKKITRSKSLKKHMGFNYLLGYLSDGSHLKRWLTSLVGVLISIEVVHGAVTMYLDLQNLFYLLYYYIFGCSC